MIEALNNPDQPKSTKQTGDRLWEFSITALVFAALVAVTSRTVADADLWGHLRFALDALENREITQIDPYSYLSTGQRWITMNGWPKSHLLLPGWQPVPLD